MLSWWSLHNFPVTVLIPGWNLWRLFIHQKIWSLVQPVGIFLFVTPSAARVCPVCLIILRLCLSPSVSSNHYLFLNKWSLTAASSSSLSLLFFSCPEFPNPVPVSSQQSSVQRWGPGGKLWKRARRAGKGQTLPKLRSQKITWTNSLMKCFATSLGEQPGRNQFSACYFIVLWFFSNFTCSWHGKLWLCHEWTGG